MRYSGIFTGYEGIQGLEDTDYLNPVKVELFSYPNYINGDLKIELPKRSCDSNKICSFLFNCFTNRKLGKSLVEKLFKGGIG